VIVPSFTQVQAGPGHHRRVTSGPSRLQTRPKTSPAGAWDNPPATQGHSIPQRVHAGLHIANHTRGSRCQGRPRKRNLQRTFPQSELIHTLARYCARYQCVGMCVGTPNTSQSTAADSKIVAKKVAEHCWQMRVEQRKHCISALIMEVDTRLYWQGL
jgi:hypothetical protein